MRAWQRLTSSGTPWQLPKRQLYLLALRLMWRQVCNLPFRKNGKLQTCCHEERSPIMSEPTTKSTTVEASKRSIEEHVARLQAAFARALSEDDILTIARKLIEQAREGDNTSARLVLKYGLAHVKFYAATDQALQSAARRAAQPSSDQMMAIVRRRMQEQEALEAEIRGMGRAPAAPHPSAASPNGKATPAGR
jgi:hypothetical protein